jgi:hypothetical protein
MTAIANRMRKITPTQVEQQTIYGIANEAVDKAQIFYTHLVATQVLTTPMLEKMDLINLQAP